MAKETHYMSKIIEGLHISNERGLEIWEIPHAVNSRYLSHDYFRYIGKFPPQIAAAFIAQYGVRDLPILDPMCGGGTTLIEAWRADIPAIGMDINPVAVLTSRVTTTPIPIDVLEPAVDALLKHAASELDGPTLFSRKRQPTSPKSAQSPELFDNERFFTKAALIELTILWELIRGIKDRRVADFCCLAFLGILRHVSMANVKKMNTEIHEGKQPKPVLSTFASKLRKMQMVNRVLVTLPAPKVQVLEKDARSIGVESESIGMVIIHPI